jgi:hypothetical protein
MKILQILIALDQLINTILGGMADETISSRAHRKQHKSRRWKFMRRIIDWIFFWQKDHCYQSYLAELDRKQLPPNF